MMSNVFFKSMPDSNPDLEPDPYPKLMPKPDLDPNNAKDGSGSVKIIPDPQIEV
jgi:hypothetical protein